MKPQNNPLTGSLGNLTQGTPGLGGSTNPGTNAAQSPSNSGLGVGLPYKGGNPFASILSRLPGQQGAPQGPQQGAPMAGGMAKPQPSVLEPGKQPGSGPFITSALQSVNKIIQMSDDPNEIQKAHLVTKILGQMLQEDTDRQNQKMHSDIVQGTGRSMGMIGQPNKSAVPSIGGFPNSSPSTTVNNVTGGAL